MWQKLPLIFHMSSLCNLHSWLHNFTRVVGFTRSSFWGMLAKVKTPHGAADLPFWPREQMEAPTCSVLQLWEAAPPKALWTTVWLHRWRASDVLAAVSLRQTRLRGVCSASTAVLARCRAVGLRSTYRWRWMLWEPEDIKSSSGLEMWADTRAEIYWFKWRTMCWRTVPPERPLHHKIKPKGLNGQERYKILTGEAVVYSFQLVFQLIADVWHFRSNRH